MEETPQPARIELIENLERVRGRPVIAYVTSTRPGSYNGAMAVDAISVIFEHLRRLGLPDREEAKIDLLLHTNGGESTVPWRLMCLLREFAARVDLLVPHHAFSSGTLTALGADEVVMHPMGFLGPTDTTIIGPFNPKTEEGVPIPIEVEDVLSYIEWVKSDVGISHEDELVQALKFLTDQVNPLALGDVKRSVLQSRMMGERLLGIRSHKVDSLNAKEIVNTLAQRLFYHGHPINRHEAKDDLQLDWVRPAKPDEEEAMWALYESYEAEMLLNKEFQPLAEAIELLGGMPELPKYDAKKPEIEPHPTVKEVTLSPQQLVWVESKKRADCREEEMTVTLSRNARGRFYPAYTLLDKGWKQRR